MAYENLGNIPDNYKHEKRVAYPAGLFENSALVLKIYEMLKVNEKDKWDPNMLLGERSMLLGEFLSNKIKEGNMKPYLGLGFAILSEGMLNVARWDVKYPYVLKNQIYEFENDDLRTDSLSDIRDIGAFCAWELGIVDHERNAWLRYLESERTVRDKNNYLTNWLESGTVL